MRTRVVAILASAGAMRWGFGISDSSDQPGEYNMMCADGQTRCRLVGVQAFVRHGARTPVYVIPSDGKLILDAHWDPDMTTDVAHTMIPYGLCDMQGKPTEFDSEVFKLEKPFLLKGGARAGTLTRIGQSEMYTIGQLLRQRYVKDLKFISEHYDSNQVYCRSTPFKRTIFSARCLMAGMFPPDELRTGEKVNIHINKLREETTFANRMACPRGIFKPSHEMCSDKKVVKVRQEVAALLGEHLSRKSRDGSGRQIPVELFAIRDDLVARKHHGFYLSPVLDSLMARLGDESARELVYNVAGPDVSGKSEGMRGAVGQLCQIISDTLTEQGKENSKCCRFQIHSTHDQALIFLLIALDLYDGHWPVFGANIVLELCETPDKRRWVHVYYCGRLITEMPLEEIQRRLRLFAVTRQQYYDICLKRPLDFDSDAVEPIRRFSSRGW